ncbi:MAG: hypothetical protein A3G84_08125 [Chloroflexi bacterium RIFCSPLOWO2_12_FULL_71_12]|nr:MAG: hypothetical protein A3G84_08125 [Chloroflexi bacterium RIFCSPLOWO2_12_FULL_71_12]
MAVLMRFGLDFGTSNTSLAVSDGSGVRLLPIDEIAGETMPTILYVRRDRSALVGRPAIEGYLADERTRGPVKRQVKLLGFKMESSNPFQKPVEANILADVDAPGRLFQSLKSFLGSPLDQPTSVFGTPMSLTALVALVLDHVRRRAQVAAARAANVSEGISLVFDFGGGTLDLCVAERRGGDVRIVATAGRAVAGDRFTQVLIDLVVAPRLGATSEWGSKRLRLPAFIVNAISDWHALSALNEKPLLDALDDLVRSGAPRRELAALRSAIEMQLGYEIFSAVDTVKIELSSEETAFLAFHRAGVDIDAVVPRRRFEVRAAPLLGEIDELLTEVLERAGLPESAVGEVVLTGGSSALPAARALLERRFPGAERRDFAAFSSVAAGLALAS